MKRKTVIAFAVVLFAAGTTGAHDLFIKLGSYFLPPNTRASVRLRLNKNFSILAT